MTPFTIEIDAKAEYDNSDTVALMTSTYSYGKGCGELEGQQRVSVSIKRGYLPTKRCKNGRSRREGIELDRDQVRALRDDLSRRLDAWP